MPRVLLFLSSLPLKYISKHILLIIEIIISKLHLHTSEDCKELTCISPHGMSGYSNDLGEHHQSDVEVKMLSRCLVLVVARVVIEAGCIEPVVFTGMLTVPLSIGIIGKIWLTHPLLRIQIPDEPLFKLELIPFKKYLSSIRPFLE